MRLYHVHVQGNKKDNGNFFFYDPLVIISSAHTHDNMKWYKIRWDKEEELDDVRHKPSVVPGEMPEEAIRRFVTEKLMDEHKITSISYARITI